MPFWPLALIKRIPLGVKVTPAQEDQNFTDIEGAVNQLKDNFNVALNADGTLKNNSVSTAAIQNRAVTVDKRAFLSNFYYTDSGAVNAILITNGAGLTLGAYAAGLIFYVKVIAANTGATTMKVDGLLPAQAVMKFTNSGVSALTGGELQANGIYEFVHDGIQFIVLNPTPAPASTPHGIPTFIIPATLVNINAASAGWVTKDITANVPAGISAVILQASGMMNAVGGAGSGPIWQVDVRPSSLGNTYGLFQCGQANQAGELDQSLNQGIYPINEAAGVRSFDYNAQILNSGAVDACLFTLKLVGYVT